MNNLRRRRRKRYSGRRKRRQPGWYSRDEIYSFSRETRSFFSRRDPASRSGEESLADRRCIQGLALCVGKDYNHVGGGGGGREVSVPYTAFKLTLLSPQMKEASWISSVYDSFSAKFHQDEGGGDMMSISKTHGKSTQRAHTCALSST